MRSLVAIVITPPISKARRFFRKDDSDREKALEFLNESLEVPASQIAWKKAAKLKVLPAVGECTASFKPTDWHPLTTKIERGISEGSLTCQADHIDVSLYFWNKF